MEALIVAVLVAVPLLAWVARERSRRLLAEGKLRSAWLAALDMERTLARRAAEVRSRHGL